jgi:hypothetical protein
MGVIYTDGRASPVQRRRGAGRSAEEKVGGRLGLWGEAELFLALCILGRDRPFVRVVYSSAVYPWAVYSLGGVFLGGVFLGGIFLAVYS